MSEKTSEECAYENDCRSFDNHVTNNSMIIGIVHKYLVFIEELSQNFSKSITLRLL